ncbi:YhfH family protein [Cerasibacillus terrae]|uniref:YhfH family protein n=1 Tax=Cerasibacillus terrae TaxID=2498845 RepID=A0A5C8NS95_9BACI|nr:protein YhfH [Cerasibacillus terrae]TXL64006.1 YhfH family protein [Cerasibacillus terrae]
MVNVLEFFRNLPKKKCQECGNAMYEQADCYGNTCDECNHPAR